MSPLLFKLTLRLVTHMVYICKTLMTKDLPIVQILASATLWKKDLWNYLKYYKVENFVRWDIFIVYIHHISWLSGVGSVEKWMIQTLKFLHINSILQLIPHYKISSRFAAFMRQKHTWGASSFYHWRQGRWTWKSF